MEIEEVRRLNLQPGDILVVRCPDAISAERAHQVQQKLQALVPGYWVIVLAPGWDLETVRPDALGSSEPVDRGVTTS